MRIVRLIVAPECDAIALAQGLADRVGLGDREKFYQFVVRLLTRRFGKATVKIVKRLDKLSAEQLEDLAEAVFDFEKIADLDLWLKAR